MPLKLIAVFTSKVSQVMVSYDVLQNRKSQQMHVQLNLFHPESKRALPRVLLLQVQVRVEEDEVNVSLQVLEAPQQQLLTLTLRLTAFDLNSGERKREETETWIKDERNKELPSAVRVRSNNCGEERKHSSALDSFPPEEAVSSQQSV